MYAALFAGFVALITFCGTFAPEHDWAVSIVHDPSKHKLFAFEQAQKKGLFYLLCGLVCFAITALILPRFPLQKPFSLFPTIGSFIFLCEGLVLLTTKVSWTEIKSGTGVPFWKQLVAFVIFVGLFFLCGWSFFYFVPGKGLD